VCNLVGRFKAFLEKIGLVNPEFGDLWIDVVPFRIIFTVELVMHGLITS
jgi:hypothetical protein